MKTILAAIALFALAVLAQAQTSNENSKLKEALRRFPQADANQDGVLTLESHSSFNKDKFLVELGRLQQKPGAP